MTEQFATKLATLKVGATPDEDGIIWLMLPELAVTVLELIRRYEELEAASKVSEKALEIAVEDISDMDRGATYKASAYISAAKRRLSGDYYPAPPVVEEDAPKETT